MPVALVLMGFSFNLGNAWLNGFYLFSLSGGYLKPGARPRFLAARPCFWPALSPTAGPIWPAPAAQTWRRRLPHPVWRAVPVGILPNYLGEIVEWSGWALATWSYRGWPLPCGPSQTCPTRPRAPCWYNASFAGYPAERKALIRGSGNSERKAKANR